ncbi:MAG: signal peptidase II [Halieaceae bacterium]|nr:signal peptidase II [Halieaceae bacterium]
MPDRLHALRWLAGWFALAALVLVVDQWTKALALAHLDYGRPVALLPVLNFTLQYNEGAAFSFLSDAGGWQRWFFSAVALVASVVIAVWLARLNREDKLLAASLSLILGGAIGNLWDRLQFGHVVDFISVHYQNWYFPTFNAADSAVTVGAGLMILDAILQSRKQAQASPEKGE